MSADGAMIMSVFAAVWWAAGIRASGHGSAPMYGIPLFVTVAIIARTPTSVSLLSAWVRRACCG
jgi:hypothetical protein